MSGKCLRRFPPHLRNVFLYLAYCIWQIKSICYQNNFYILSKGDMWANKIFIYTQSAFSDLQPVREQRLTIYRRSGHIFPLDEHAAEAVCVCACRATKWECCARSKKDNNSSNVLKINRLQHSITNYCQLLLRLLAECFCNNFTRRNIRLEWLN